MDRRSDAKDLPFRENKVTTTSKLEERIFIAGFGGQGVMVLGKILAWAGLREKWVVSWLPSYGAEMRGGTAHCFVRLASQKIGSPTFAYPTIAFIFNQLSWDKFTSKVRKAKLVIVNSSLVKSRYFSPNVNLIPLNQLALEVGSLKLVNTVALGFFLKKRKLLKLSTVEIVLKSFFKEKEIVEMNLKALRVGINYG